MKSIWTAVGAGFVGAVVAVALVCSLGNMPGGATPTASERAIYELLNKLPDGRTLLIDYGSGTHVLTPFDKTKHLVAGGIYDEDNRLFIPFSTVWQIIARD